ncbi:rubrerythrin [Thermococcus sp. CX2]|nr:rubrerythrin [Thermococcus sp. CX2]
MTTSRYKTKKKAQFEKIIQTLSQLNHKELISYWIDQEVKEAEMYHRLYTMSKEIMWDERVPKLFFELYRDSLGHAEILLRLYHTMFPGENVVQVDIPPLEVELSEDRLREMVFKGNLGDIIEYMMGTERLAHEVYRYLADHATDEKTKATLVWLADIENGHYERLRKIYEALFGDELEKE